ncbi:MAG TPA: glycoside hydrolase family 38 C-terminal domain-containing protein [Pyrinomonadaceae bacterium]|jgi:alpha-mannosidase
MEKATRARSIIAIALLVLFAAAAIVRSQPRPDPKPVLYVVATSHLDSQWNWTVQDTIREFVPNTFFDNFKRFEQYPAYTFNYEGAIHYMWFKEYHPEAWPTLQNYVAAGRWRLAGSWINAVDVNVPSPESLMRQALYGKRFFRQEFGKVSQDVYLPDCFGFGFALPSIATHSGLSAFSTQKLTWGSSYGIPFPLGRWKGVDGNWVVAALNPGDYVSKIRSDISVDPKWASDRLTPVGNGRRIGFRYFGTGDIGGAPDTESVDWLQKSIANNAGSVEVRNTSADQLARDLTLEEKAALPEYEGELTMKTHGVGCYTSQAAMKRFNRENELLADAAERAGVAAQLFAGLEYPGERLRDAWTRVLWHQFHDDLTGTSIPQAYQFSWNDELVSANQFGGVLTSSTSAIADRLDTRGTAIPLVVYNPLSTRRRDPVEATIEFTGSAPSSIHVIDRATQRKVPVQVLETQGNKARILILADMPSVGFKVFEVAPGAGSRSAASSLSVTSSSLENARYEVKIDSNGDIASVFDKQADRELLKAPVRLELRDDPSPDKPAWRILWDTVNSPPREYVSAPEVRVVERGPVRVAIEITRKAAGSTFVQRLMLTDGGNRLDVENTVDWKSPNSLLKASFPFAASNQKATYDLGLGTIQRGNNTPDHYEVPAQKWADLTDEGGAYGAAVLNDSKYGWDKPADNILRLTLIHTGKARAYPYQSSNDLGHHHFTYSIAGHSGDWRTGQVPVRAEALNQPLVAFQTEAHGGPLGRSVSLLSLDDPTNAVAVRALKKAEDSDEIVVRVQELYGRPAQIRIKFALPIQSAREINAAEESVGSVAPQAGNLAVALKPYQPRTFALGFQEPVDRRRVSPRPAKQLDLPFNLDGVSTDANRADGDFDGKGQTLASELLPQKLQLDGLWYKFGPTTPGAMNVLVPKGQTLPLPRGAYNRVYVIAAAVGGDLETTIAGQTKTIREWQGPVGQWDSRLKEPRQLREVQVAPMTRGQTWTADAIQSDLVVSYDPGTGVVSGIDQIRRGFVKRDEIAWVGTHRHAPEGNQPYIASYLFAYAVDLPAGVRELRLPNDDRIRILAVTATREPFRLWLTTALYASDLPTR